MSVSMLNSREFTCDVKLFDNVTTKSLIIKNICQRPTMGDSDEERSLELLTNKQSSPKGRVVTKSSTSKVQRDVSEVAAASQKGTAHADESDDRAEVQKVDVAALLNEVKILRKRELCHKRIITKLQFKLTTVKAIVRSYRTKFKSVRTLAMAGITRDEMHIEMAESRLECGAIKDEVKSDVEDEQAHNKVDYSYIDNEIFDTDL